ncbi:MAG: hypothetical protein RBT59_10755 [Arcobacteraceae bacterium]|jgi:hypothetical protein|nr:hypothetical protein [Arcobacteraceae bacterium]
MRGSIYYQTSQLVKLIFEHGAKKIDRIDKEHKSFNKIGSYDTMDSYRTVWNNLLKFLKEEFDIRDCEQIESYHIGQYLYHKTENFPAEQYIQKISSAIAKLEFALQLLSIHKNTGKTYDFSIRQNILDECRDKNLLLNNYHNRAYKNPLKLIDRLENPMHQLAAMIELSGGARIKGCALIKKEQLKGYELDEITQQVKGVLVTKEKGGKIGLVKIDSDIYKKLCEYIEERGIFKIIKAHYYKDIIQGCKKEKINPEASHGFRWNFAQRRTLEYVDAGYYYDQALQAVSNEMKHNRASITLHYHG